MVFNLSNNGITLSNTICMCLFSMCYIYLHGADTSSSTSSATITAHQPLPPLTSTVGMSCESPCLLYIMTLDLRLLVYRVYLKCDLMINMYRVQSTELHQHALDLYSAPSQM